MMRSISFRQIARLSRSRQKAPCYRILQPVRSNGLRRLLLAQIVNRKIVNSLLNARAASTANYALNNTRSRKRFGRVDSGTPM